MGTEELKEQLSQVEYTIDDLNKNQYISEDGRRLPNFSRGNSDFCLETLPELIGVHSNIIMNSFLNQKLDDLIEDNVNREEIDKRLFIFEKEISNLNEYPKRILNITLIQMILENREYLHQNHTNTLLKELFQFNEADSLTFIWVYSEKNKRGKIV